MIARVVAFCARRPLSVLLSALLVAFGCYWAQRSLARDAIPDLSDPQIALAPRTLTEDGPAEVARQVTEVVTRELQGVPGTSTVRGSSMSGMAYVDVVFNSASGLAAGRAEIVRRVAALRPRLPASARIQVGPTASATGWVFQYVLLPPEKRQAMPMAEAQHRGAHAQLVALRRFQEEVLRPALSKLPGVAEVATLGGETDEVVVETSADQLHGGGAALSDLVSSLQSALDPRRPRPGLEQLERQPLLQKVAKVRVEPAMSSGAADVDGAVSVIVGTVVAERDADPAAVILRVKQAIEQERHRLPPEARLGVMYDRSELTARIGHTLLRAVGEEVVVVALVVLLFLVHWQSALVPIITLPFIVLLTFAGMRMLGVPATVMSLGGIAIALGMAVDAELVALEACHRRLEANGGVAPSPPERKARLLAAAGSFTPAVVVSLLIAALAFAPVFVFGGETGRLLRPLAISKTLVVLAAALVTLTLAPALRDRLLGGRILPELDNPLTRTLVRAYRPFVHFALARPTLTLVTAAFAALSCLPIVSRLGSEFLPRLEEGDLLYMPTTATGLTHADAPFELAAQDRSIATHPAVAAVYGKIGRAETATDPAPLSMAETTIRLKPRSAWPTVKRERWYSAWAPQRVKRVLGGLWPEQEPMTSAELVESLDRSTAIPGWTNAWTAPVRARIDMMSTGVRTPVGIRIVTRDPKRIAVLAAAAREAVLAVPGTRSAVYEGLGGETRLSFELDEAALRRHGVERQRAQALAELVIAGGGVGEVESADSSRSGSLRALPVRLSISPAWLDKPTQDLLRDATVRAGTDGTGQPVALGLLGRPKYQVVPATLRAERGELSGYVHVDLAEGTDLAGFVAQARTNVTQALSGSGAGVKLLAGERIE